MNRFFLAATVALMASPAFSQTAEAVIVDEPLSAFDQATVAGVCGVAGVATAEFVAADQISVSCNEDVTGFAPLLGGLAPVLLGGAAAAAALAATAGGDSTSDTQ